MQREQRRQSGGGTGGCAVQASQQGFKLEKAATFMANENSSDKTQVSATTKKPYEKPSFRYEQVFVTTALSCGKTGTQAQCSLNIKVS